MRVVTLIPHESTDHRLHPEGDVYELADTAHAHELALRLKDGIVREAPSIPDPAEPVAAAMPAPAATE